MRGNQKKALKNDHLSNTLNFYKNKDTEVT